MWHCWSDVLPFSRDVFLRGSATAPCCAHSYFPGQLVLFLNPRASVRQKAQTKWAVEDSSAYRLSSGSETGSGGTRGASCLGSFCRTLLGLLLCLPLTLGMCHFRLCLVVIYCLPPMLVSFCTSSLLLGRMLLSKFSTEEYTNDGELEWEALRETTLWLFQSNKITKTSTTRNGTD